MELLKKLVNAFGPSGEEDRVSNIIEDEIKDFADEIKRDKSGNITAFKKGTKGGKMMIAAHMDQIGAVILDIDKSGYIRFANIGGVDPYVILYHSVVFESGVCGVVAKEEKKDIKDIKTGDLYIDIGAKDKEDALKKVNIGDFGVFNSDFIENGKRISCVALDDRIGCYVMLQTLKRVKKAGMDTYFVFTSQEETYSSGAATAAFRIEPDCSIVIDVTDTGDTINGIRSAVKMGNGAAVTIMDKGLMSHPEINRCLVDTAKNNNIKYQFDVAEQGATDGAKIHVAKSGVKTGALSIPVRYMHTPHEVVDMNDVESAIDIMVKVVEDYVLVK